MMKDWDAWGSSEVETTATCRSILIPSHSGRNVRSPGRDVPILRLELKIGILIGTTFGMARVCTWGYVR